MKSLAIIIAVLAALVFVVGGVLAVVGTLPVQQYAVASGIIGSIASVIGLAALIRPRLTASDLRNVESELIGNVAQATRAIEEYESKMIAKQGADR
jgi:membrane protein implicated in regulation of membrane protease activity